MPKLFTLDEANTLIPELEKTLGELRSLRRSISEARRHVASIEQHANQNGHDRTGDLKTARKQLSEIIANFDVGLTSINDLGCELKDLETGLLDFRTMREGRVVYLCWKSGEPKIDFWHELREGFAGRQRL